MFPPGIVIPPPHNVKRKPYQVPPGVGSPPPHNEISIRTPEARHTTTFTYSYNYTYGDILFAILSTAQANSFQDKAVTFSNATSRHASHFIIHL